jgi:lactoylglutathione lyase
MGENNTNMSITNLKTSAQCEKKRLYLRARSSQGENSKRIGIYQFLQMSTPHINLVVIRSKDIFQAKSFYEKIGLSMLVHQHGDSPEHLVCRNGGFVFEIYPLLPDSTPTTGTRVGFKVDSIDAILDANQLSQYLHTKPMITQWGRRAKLVDIDGHLVDLFESELV